MTPSQEPESDQPSRRGRRWLAVGLTLGTGLLVVGGAAGVMAWVWGRDNLMPWLSAELSEVLGRPVELGPLERLGPTGIRVGPSTLPATETDPDSLAVGAIEVGLNPLDLLRRDIRLAIDLEQVEAYLEQAADGEWVAIDLDLPEPDRDRDPFIEVNVGTVRLRDSQATLVPYGSGASDRPRIVFADIQGQGDFSNVELEVEPDGLSAKPRRTQQIDFTLGGKSVQGGRVDLKGAVRLPPPKPRPGQEQDRAAARPAFLAWVPAGLLRALVLPAPPALAAAPAADGPGLRGTINLRTQDLRSTDLMPLVESFLEGPLPVQFPTGTVSGSVDTELGGELSPSFTGSARVEGTTITGDRLPEPLEELAGDVRVQGQTFTFEGVTARMGELTAKAGGTLDLKDGYDLSGTINPFSLEQAAALVGTELPVPASGTFVADVTMTGPLGKPVIGTVLTAQETVTIDQVAFGAMRAEATLAAGRLTFDRLEANPQAGGSIAGNGAFTFGEPGQLTLNLTGDRLPADAIGRLYGLPETLELGPVSAEVAIAGPVGQLTGTARWRAPLGTYPAQGTVRLANNALQFSDTFVQVAGGTVAGSGSLALASRRWNSTLRATGLQLSQLGAGVAGVVNGEGQFSGSLSGGLAGIQGQAGGQALLAGGDVNGRATLNGGQWAADVQANELQLRAFAPDLQGTAGGRFRFTGSTDDLTLAGVRGQGQIGLSDGLATAASRAPQLAQVREPLIADLAWDGRSVQVQRAATAGVTASGFVTPQLSGPGAPAIANLDLNLNVDGFSLAALPVPEVIPLGGQAFFDGRLRGRPGTLALTGTASLVGLQTGGLAFDSPLSGPVSFAQGGPLAVNLVGRGDNLISVTAQNSRYVDFRVVNDLGDPAEPNALATGTVRGDLLTADIAHLPIDDLRLPQGGVEGIGTVSGTITAAQIVANLREPWVQASFDIDDPGLGYLSLPTAEVVLNDGSADDGAVDNADAAAAPSLVPRERETKYSRLYGEVTYRDRTISTRDTVLEAAPGCADAPPRSGPNVPLGASPGGRGATPAADTDCSKYVVSGTYALGPTPRVNGRLMVQNGRVQEILQTLLIFELADFRPNLLKPPAWFRPATPADLASLNQVNPVGDRNATLLDQIRRLAEVQELQDILAARAEAAPLPPLEELVGTFSGNVTAQGTVPDSLEVAFNLRGDDWRWGDPDLNPNSITYRFDEVIAQGRFQDQVLRLNPVSLSASFEGFSEATPTGVALASLNGDLSFNPADPAERTLRLEVSNVPMQALRQPLRLPNNLDGLVNLGASLTGTLANPQVRGQLAVNEATINRNAIDLATATFSYQEARFNLLSRLAIDEQVDPLRLRASVPLPLPGIQQQPASDQVDIALRMQDEGFALINLLTQAIAWEGGDASLALDVQGRWPVNKPLQDALTTLTVTGNAELDGVTLSARSLPEPLTNLRGTIAVVEDPDNPLGNSVYSNGLTLNVQNLQGDFSNGKVLARGNLKLLPSVRDLAPGLFDDNIAAFSEPEADAGADPNAPFQLVLDNIALDLRNPAGTYRGQVNGDVRVGGSVFLLSPLVYGEVRLSNGLLTLPEAGQSGATPSAFVPSREPSIFEPLPPVLEDFQLVLAENVRLAIPGLVDVRAEGSLDLVGTAPNVKPNGRINLPSGRINLLTTEFRLTGDENYAEFSDLDETIDPYLVANLSAAVPDSAAAGNSLAVATPFPRNEISVSRLDQLGLTQAGVQTVRIRASVNGRASRVVNLQGVELESTPPRSEGEIVALISGGLLAALESTVGSVSGGGDSFQGLLVFAGSALLNNLQGLIGSGLERTDLRLFSASPPGGQQGVVDIGGELGFNVSPNISVSVQKVFTNVTPALFSVRYRINDQITLRAITSYEQFNENTGAVLEFRF